MELIRSKFQDHAKEEIDVKNRQIENRERLDKKITGVQCVHSDACISTILLSQENNDLLKQRKQYQKLDMTLNVPRNAAGNIIHSKDPFSCLPVPDPVPL